MHIKLYNKGYVVSYIMSYIKSNRSAKTHLFFFTFLTTVNILTLAYIEIFTLKINVLIFNTVILNKRKKSM